MVKLSEKRREVAQLCLTLCDPMDCSLPGSSVHGIFQVRVLEWVAISFSRESSQPKDRTWVSHVAGRHFTIWATREVQAVLRAPFSFPLAAGTKFPAVAPQSLAWNSVPSMCPSFTLRLLQCMSYFLRPLLCSPHSSHHVLLLVHVWTHGLDCGPFIGCSLCLECSSPTAPPWPLTSTASHFSIRLPSLNSKLTHTPADPMPLICLLFPPQHLPASSILCNLLFIMFSVFFIAYYPFPSSF